LELVAWRARHSAQRARDGEPRVISLSAFNEFRSRQFDLQEKQEVISTGSLDHIYLKFTFYPFWGYCRGIQS
jgi:hypothetical protein